MKLHTTFAIGAILTAAALAACGGDDTNGGAAGSAGNGTGGGTGGNATGGGGSATGGGGSANTGGGGTANTGGSGGTMTDGSTEAGCTCTGTACTPAGVLFNFDPGADGGTSGWAAYVPPGADSGPAIQTTIAQSTESHTSPGSLSFTVPFTGFGQNVSVQHNFGDAPGRGALDWSCKTKLHFWVKVQASSDAGTISFLNGVQAYVQSGNPPDDAGSNGYSRYTTGVPFLTAMSLGDGQFHETVIDLVTPGTTPGNTVNPSDINQIGVQILTPDTAPADGGSAQGTVTVFIDDITLE